MLRTLHRCYTKEAQISSSAPAGKPRKLTVRSIAPVEYSISLTPASQFAGEKNSVVVSRGAVRVRRGTFFATVTRANPRWFLWPLENFFVRRHAAVFPGQSTLPIAATQSPKCRAARLSNHFYPGNLFGWYNTQPWNGNGPGGYSKRAPDGDLPTDKFIHISIGRLRSESCDGRRRS